MGKIYCLMGKSASGKDSIYKKILEKAPGRFKTIVSYTTRPIRSGETEGVEYHFVSVPEFKAMDEADKVIEYRCYHTVHGDWYYFTANDGQINLDRFDYLLIMTPEGCNRKRKFKFNVSLDLSMCSTQTDYARKSATAPVPQARSHTPKATSTWCVRALPFTVTTAWEQHHHHGRSSPS